MDVLAGTITVRPVTSADYEAAGALLAESFGGSERQRERLRENVGRRAGRARVLVAIDADGAVLGTATYVERGRFRRDPLIQLARPGEAEVRLLAVAPQARKRGVALLLMRACIEEARRRGRRRLVASNDPANTASHRLDMAAGLTRCAERDWTDRAGRTTWAWSIEL